MLLVCPACHLPSSYFEGTACALAKLGYNRDSAYGALTRTESRGAHFRQDFPRRNDAEKLKRTLAT